ncbi:hypothetical protein FQA39_LY13607 [Lamprigera yunnana]|nr:hypothetical protein FQA39_LY13607 [Lamprigera yunnana]
MYKESSNILDGNAFCGLAVLMDGFAASWQGVKTFVDSWSKALELLRLTFEPKKPSHRVYRELFAEEESAKTPTDVLICKARQILSHLSKNTIGYGPLGADNLHDELEDFVSSWKLFNDKSKDRIKFVEDMKEFIDTHDSMSSWLSAKEKMLTVLGPISSNSGMVQSQVQQNLERQLEGQRPLLADLETAGTQLCNVLSNPASRTDIQAKLGSVGRQYNTLQKKLDYKKVEIEGALRESRQFEASCSKTLGWLSDEIGLISERLLVSADRDVLEQQLAHHEPIYRDVLSRKHEVIMLLNKGRDIIVRNNKTDSRVLQRDIDKIQQQWDKLRKETVKRQTSLLTCIEYCCKYYLALETFLPWLRKSEDKLDSLKPSSFKRKHIEKQLKDLQSFRNDVWKKSGEYENTRSLGDTFHLACDIDKDVVKNELYQLKERWDKLNNDLIARTQALENQSRKLSNFNENLRELQTGLERCEDKLASHDALGGVAHDPKLLDRVKTLRDEVGKLKKPHQSCRQ